MLFPKLLSYILLIYLVLCQVTLSALISPQSAFSAKTSFGVSFNRSSFRLKDMSVPIVPERIIVGYANWNQCDDMIVEAVRQGVNVLIWFSVNLIVDQSGNPGVSGGPDMDCVADKVEKIRAEGYTDVVHLISIGGWNSPHPVVPNSANPALDVFNAFDQWNRIQCARPEKGFFGFDGFDWDVEGNDNLNSPFNEFTVSCLDLMGEMSQLAKISGYIVSMAPAESYLDPTTREFNRSLKNTYDEWNDLPTVPQPFTYRGRNTYAYLLSKFGNTSSIDSNNVKDTFDFITIQLYEGYSHAEYNVSVKSMAPEDVLFRFASSVTNGWEVDFSTDSELGFPFVKEIKVNSAKLVIGLANGWAGDGKFLLIYPEQVRAAFERLANHGLSPRGFAFWNILDEGKSSQLRPYEPVWMAHGLNRFLKIRDIEENA